jgi:hypothetical protein
MTRRIIPQRIRFFLAVEGECEQTFVRWLNILSKKKGLPVHLDSLVLEGGGYSTMLNRVMRSRQFREYKDKSKANILLIDGDRGIENEDGWSLDDLREEASKAGITVCVQDPKIEALYLRMMPGNEHLTISRTRVNDQLRKVWRDCDNKKFDVGALMKKFSLDDLQRVAHVDSELRELLKIIGIYE